MMNNAHILKENDRVSIKGHGKFIYLGQSKVTKKGRLFVKIKIYCWDLKLFNKISMF
jgi:RNA-binding protein YlmH